VRALGRPTRPGVSGNRQQRRRGPQTVPNHEEVLRAKSWALLFAQHLGSGRSECLVLFWLGPQGAVGPTERLLDSQNAVWPGSASASPNGRVALLEPAAAQPPAWSPPPDREQGGAAVQHKCLTPRLPQAHARAPSRASPLNDNENGCPTTDPSPLHQGIKAHRSVTRQLRPSKARRLHGEVYMSLHQRNTRGLGSFALKAASTGVPSRATPTPPR
jgi:hypothetical protein